MDIKIGGYPLDKEQYKIATSNDKELLVVAGAGSGKTFTIVGRIWYLINVKKLRWWLMSNFGKINQCDYLQSRSMRRGQDNTGIFLINIDHLVGDKTSGAVKL